MNDVLLSRLMTQCALGKLYGEPEPVSGGFMHKMYRVATDKGVFAVKHLNREVMARPGVFENYARADSLEAILEQHDIPIVPSLTLCGRKMQQVDDDYFYIFNWQNGAISDWNTISAAQCEKAGNILGRIHAIEPRDVPHEEPVPCAIDWHVYTERAVMATHAASAESGLAAQKSELAVLLSESEELLDYAQKEVNRARESLPDIVCISNEDMDPKNIMWDDGAPHVIDLECLNYGNPVSHVLQLALQWAGITTCSLDVDNVAAFFRGYLAAYDSGFRSYPAVFGLAYTWIEWLEYNIRRAIEDGFPEDERQLGIEQVRQTICRIRYIREHEEKIKVVLENICYTVTTEGTHA